MVKRSVCITLLMLVIYGLWVSYCHIKPVSQYQSQNNAIIAENYLYSDSAMKEDVILGTSISSGLQTNVMPHGIYLMALAGQSVYDGMDVIESAHAHPKYLFIEANSILSAGRPQFLNYLTNKPNYYRKKYLPFMRDNYQPAGQTYNVVVMHAMGAIRRFTTYIYDPLIRIFYKGKETGIDKEDMYASAKRKNQPIDTVLLNAAFAHLKQRVDRFTKSGTIVCFYGVPDDEVIFNSKISRTIREDFRVRFTQDKYPSMPATNIQSYRTTDQIHLDAVSDIKFSRDLGRKIDSIRNKYTHQH
jgi:hypothetical protein